MTEEKRPKRVRRTVTAQSPGPPAQTIGVDASLLADLAGKMGELTAEVRGVKTEVKGINNRMQRLEEAAQEQAIKNESAHGESKAEIRALGATVARLDADRRTPPPGGASEGRKEDPISKASKLLEFAEKWVPKLVFWGGLAAGLLTGLYKWAQAAASKGGHPTP